MIRKACRGDIEAVARIYEAIHDSEEAGSSHVGWIRGVYPTKDTALAALEEGILFVCEDAGNIVASAKIDQTQVPAYAGCRWAYDAPDSEVMVLHTLVVDPHSPRKGYGKQFVAFYEEYALEHGCRYLRIDTNARNNVARAMYQKLGFREADIIPCEFNGIPGVNLVCLEKKLG